MKTNVFIIRQGTPESRLLSRIGFDRESLEVVEWRGRRRARGGYGRSPVAWRISGRKDVEKLCIGLVEIIGNKPQDQRSSEQQTTLERAKSTLSAFRNRSKRAAKRQQALSVRTPLLLNYLSRQFPSASSADLDAVIDEINQRAPRSLSDVAMLSNEKLFNRPVSWKKAKQKYIEIFYSSSP